jgi:hypothetical protein
VGDLPVGRQGIGLPTSSAKCARITGTRKNPDITSFIRATLYARLVRHAFAVIGNDDRLASKINVHALCVSIERILDQFKNGDLIVRDQFASQNAL